MPSYPLNGLWHLCDDSGSIELPGQVPGNVHTDLLAVGLLKDPYFREQELEAQWVAERDWTYRKNFEVDSALLAHESVRLRCEGLDTFATIRINGHEVGRADNMHRTWQFDVKEALHAGENHIEIRFASVWPYIRENESIRHLETSSHIAHEHPGRPWVRKEQSNFGWDWGPVLVTSGIWREIGLLAFDGPQIADLHLRQQHEPGLVSLSASVRLDSPCKAGDHRLEFRLSLDGRIVTTAESRFSGDTACAVVDVPNPRLWFPAGMGEQPLYVATVRRLSAKGDLLEEASRRIGLRKIELVRENDPWGESFYFRVNGVPFFAKGSNWIPADALRRSGAATYRHLLESAVEANQNMIRVWGGGIYEAEHFYDTCDELGLCVWQDFMFACSAYPLDKPDFVENCRAEAVEIVRRLRHHPCLALWCGNNEIEMKWTAFGEKDVGWPLLPARYYRKWFDEDLASIISTHDPDAAYWPCSPHTPTGDRNDFNDPNTGDAHLWDVWHGYQPFEWFRSSTHRFCSEFGFQSYPEPRTVEAYTAPEDRNITSPVMEFHQRSSDGNRKIIHYMLDWFRMPSGYEAGLWLSQLQQGLAIKYAVEHWRRNMPRCMGALYWQLNDNWPVASWSSIDHQGRWKALHYFAKRFFAPILVSGLESEDPEDGRVEVHLTSDRPAPEDLTLRWTLTATDGAELAGGEKAVEAGVRENRLVHTLDCRQALRERSPRETLVWLELWKGDDLLSHDFVTFVRPKALALEEPGIEADVRPEGDGCFRITLNARRPALWAWTEVSGINVRYSDNFLCLRPGAGREVNVQTDSPCTAADIRSALRVRSLFDLG